MIDRDASWVAAATGGRLAADGAASGGPARAVIDSRSIETGDLFFGLSGENADGGVFAAAAIKDGAWGAVIAEAHAAHAVEAGRGVVVAVDDPLGALASLAGAWRRELACAVVGITGSTGKTSTKDILAAMLAPHRSTHSSRENLNTEIGLPLAILEAPRGTEVMVLEMAMRGPGQIAELARIAEPDVGVVLNVGPVHLELLGTVEAVAAAKAELIQALRAGASCVVPANEPLLDPHLRRDVETTTFGHGGDVALAELVGSSARVDAGRRRITLELGYLEPHNVTNTLAAIAAAHALGVEPEGRIEPRFSSLRGEVVDLGGAVTVVNDCYNANPMSMRAALDHLARSEGTRKLAVLGEMAELGPDELRYHREIGAWAGELGIDVLITVGETALAYTGAFSGEIHSVGAPAEAGALLSDVVRPGDRVLVKGSRSAGLERVLEEARR